MHNTHHHVIWKSSGYVCIIHTTTIYRKASGYVCIIHTTTLSRKASGYVCIIHTTTLYGNHQVMYALYTPPRYMEIIRLCMHYTHHHVIWKSSGYVCIIHTTTLYGKHQVMYASYTPPRYMEIGKKTNTSK